MIAVPRVVAVTFGLAVVVSTQAAAQECLGITAGSRGYFSYGVAGTDGATGETFTLGVRLSNVTLQLQRRTLEPVSLADDIEHVQLQAAYPIARKFPLCVFGGFAWTGYDTDQVFGWGTDEQGNTFTHGSVGGYYTQVQIPIGISLGKESKLTENFRAAGFVQNALLYDIEKGDGFDGQRVQHSTLGVGVTVGLGLSYGPILLRSTVSNYKTMNSSMGLYNDFPYMSLQLGVKF